MSPVPAGPRGCPAQPRLCAKLSSATAFLTVGDYLPSLPACSQPVSSFDQGNFLSLSFASQPAVPPHRRPGGSSSAAPGTDLSPLPPAGASISQSLHPLCAVGPSPALAHLVLLGRCPVATPAGVYTPSWPLPFMEGDPVRPRGTKHPAPHPCLSHLFQWLWVESEGLQPQPGVDESPSTTLRPWLLSPLR